MLQAVLTPAIILKDNVIISLVGTGVTTEPALQDPSNNIQPDYYTGKISDMLKFSEA